MGVDVQLKQLISLNQEGVNAGSELGPHGHVRQLEQQLLVHRTLLF